MTIEDEYRKVRPNYETFCERMSLLLQMLLNEAEIKIHAMERRVKNVESFRQKVLRPEKHYSDPLRQITDLCGIRIIAYYLQDVERIGKLLECEFDVDYQNSSDRGAVLKPNEFGYRSHHFVIKVSRARRMLPEWRGFSGFCAEIQVRTVLQHGWAAISHALQYKAKTSVSDEISRKLFLVSGLLELADEQFSEISCVNTKLSEDAAYSIARGDLNIPINRVSISQYLKKSDTPKMLTQYAINAGFKPETEIDREICETSPISELVEICLCAGLKTISGVEATCTVDFNLISKFYKQLISTAKTTWWGGPPAWFVLLAIIIIRREHFNKNVLMGLGWDEEISDSVVNSAELVSNEYFKLIQL